MADSTGYINTQFARPELFTLTVGSILTIDGTVTIPSGKYLKFNPGGKITGSGTINGGIIDASPLQHIFSTDLSVNPESTLFGWFSGRWFGAHPSLSDNQPTIQKAIDTAIKNYLPSVYLPRGTYNIAKGLLFIADRDGSGNYAEHVTVDFFGDRKTHSTNGSETVINCTHVDNFAIGGHLLKACSFKDFAIKGPNILSYNHLQAWSASTTYLTSGSRDNNFSPFAAIVIDPFHANVIAENRYPKFESYYDGVTIGSGSTDCHFEGIAINGFTVGVLLSPNGVTQNNESHVFDGLWLSNLKVGYAACNSQERNIKISNWKIWESVKTCFTNCMYGLQMGDSPIIDNINIAGNVFEIFHILNRGYNPFLRVENIFAESFYRIGTIHINAKINNSTFHLGEPYPQTGSLQIQPWVLYAGGSHKVKFTNSTILHYNNKPNFPFKIKVDTSPEYSVNLVEFETCISNMYSLEGSVSGNLAGYGDEAWVTNSFYHNTPRSIMLNMEYSKYIESIGIGIGYEIFLNAGANQYGGPSIGVIKHKVLSAGIRSVHQTGTANITVSNGRGIFDAAFAGMVGLIRVGDPVFSMASITDQFGQTIQANHIGQVESIAGDIVTLDGITDGLVTGSYPVLIKYGQLLKLPILGNVVAGSNQITNVLHKGNYVSGNRISCRSFPHGTYITSISGTTISVSKNSTITGDNEIICSYDYEESGYTTGNPFSCFPINVTIRKGTKLQNIDGNSPFVEYVCTRSGVFGTENPPIFSQNSYNYLEANQNN